MTAPQQILLTEPEAADALRLSPRMLRKARNEGRLRYVLIGRRVRYTMEDLESFVDSLRQVQPQCPPQPMPVHSGKKTNRTRQGAEIIPFHLRTARRAHGERL